MQKPFEQMSLSRLRSTIARLKINIEINRDKNPKLARRYEYDLRRAEYYENLARDNKPNKRKVEKTIKDGLTTLLKTPYKHENYSAFCLTLLTYLKNKDL